MFQSKDFMRLLMRAAPLLNTPVAAIATSPRFGVGMGRTVTVITYKGADPERPSPSRCPTP